MTASILVVDDQESIRHFISKNLEDEGYDVTCASAGKEALAAIRSQPPDLVLLDLMLGGEDGLALTREIRSRTDIPIVMLTGKGDVIDRVVGLEVGADDWLAKPFEIKSFTEKVSDLLAQRQKVLR